MGIARRLLIAHLLSFHATLSVQPGCKNTSGPSQISLVSVEGGLLFLTTSSNNHNQPIFHHHITDSLGYFQYDENAHIHAILSIDT